MAKVKIEILKPFKNSLLTTLHISFSLSKALAISEKYQTELNESVVRENGTEFDLLRRWTRKAAGSMTIFNRVSAKLVSRCHTVKQRAMVSNHFWKL